MPVLLIRGAFGFPFPRLAFHCSGKEDLGLKATSELGTRSLYTSIGYENAAKLSVFCMWFFLDVEMIGRGIFFLSLKLTVLADNSLLQESFVSLFVNISVYLLDQRLHLVHI